ncbi:unnamed protein product [Phaedon cochleariae]|uniref:NACHT domain-containing protein n=1 Tax=Phaedon cochleariae TaxID=80249 RepID=A0A9P0DR43_PHACE|nr:unnamed protein product [Phaedon cochleariae]
MANNDAGRSGTDYQLKVFRLIALQAISLQHETWELSTENENAGKFDDVVFESGDGGIDILIQCKHKKGKKKSKDPVLDWKTLLPEYYNSYKMKICNSFKRKLLMILCSNIGPSDGDFLEPIKIAIIPGKYKSYQFKSSKIKEIQGILNAFDDHSLKFCEEFRFLHIDDSAIEDGIKNKLEEAQKMFGLKFSKLDFKEKIDEFFQGKLQKERRIRKSHVIAFLYDSRRQGYLEELDSFDTDFKKLYDFGGNQMTNIVSNHHFLNILKIHRSLLRVHSPSRNNQHYKKDQLLFIDPSDRSVILDKIIISFELDVYCILVISLNSDQFRTIKSRINDILNKRQYKKVILLSEVPIQDDVIQDEIKFTDLTERCQTTLLSKEVNFQGKCLPIEELINNSVENIDSLIDQETIIDLINNKNITIGTAIRELGEIEHYYIERKFELGKMVFTEQDVCNFLGQPGKFVLISDGAGMGKTTILTKLGCLIKKTYPSSFLIRVDLNMFTSIFKEFQTADKISLEEILQSKDTNYFKNSLEQNVFSNTKNIILMVDAVDEISPDYTSLVNNFMLQTSVRKNVSKIFVTTRPHLTENLESFLKTKSYQLLPYSELEQTDFLIKYWKRNLTINDDEKLIKCEIYAKTLISKIRGSIGFTSWILIGIPLQTRMIAEIFQGSDDKKYQWVCCKEFLLSENETMKLPDKFNITKLYDVFVEKKLEIFIEEKCATGGNVKTKEIISKKYEDYINEHQKLAARLLLNNHQYALMNVSKHVYNSSKEIIIGMGMLQEIGDELLFVHETFAEYFLANAIWVQLKETAERNEFLMFLLEQVFTDWNFEIIRSFFEGILTNEYSQIPMKVFEICGSTFDSITWHEFKNISILVREGRKNIVKLILEKSQNNESVLHNHDRLFEGKTLLGKALEFQEIIEFLLDKGADVNGRDKHGRTILHYAAEGRKIELVKYLVSRGATIHVVDRKGYTPFHLSVHVNSSEMLSFFIENGADVNTKAGKETPLHRAVKNQDFEMVEELTRRDVNNHENNCNKVTALHFAEYVGNVNILNHLLEKDRGHTPSGVDIDIQENDCKTPLHSAAEKGHLDCLKILVDSGGDVNIQDNEGDTPLHWAAYQGHLDCLKILVDSGGDVNIQDNNGGTLLHWAARQGHSECLKILIGSKGDVNIQDNKGDTPLHWAAYEGHLDCLKILVGSGGDVNIQDNNGYTPLYWAAYQGNLDFLKILVDSGGDVNIQYNNGDTALHWAAYQGHLDCLKILVDSGGDVNIKYKNGDTLLHWAAYQGHLDYLKILVESGGDVNIQDNKGGTPLHWAAYQCHLDCLRILVDSGGDVNIKDYEGATPLHWAAYKGHLYCLKILVNSGGDVEIRDNDGTIPLHRAAGQGHSDCLKILIRSEGDVNIQDNYGHTALHWAAYQGHLKCLKILVGSGGNVNIQYNNGDTLLHWAACQGHFECSNILVNSGGDVNIQNEKGETPLHWAAYQGHLDCLKILVDSGGNVNIQYNNGDTLLHWAAYQGHLDCLQILVGSGGDVNIQDNYGHTPLHWAAYQGHLNCLEILVGSGGNVNIQYNNGDTLLHWAARQGHFKCLNILVNSGGDVNIQNKEGETPLHWAAYQGHLYCLKILIKSKCDVNIQDNKGDTPLDWAAYRGRSDCFEILVNSGAM